MCVYVCVWFICVFMIMLVCTFMWKPEVDIRHLSQLPLVFLIHCFSLNLKLLDWARPARKHHGDCCLSPMSTPQTSTEISSLNHTPVVFFNLGVWDLNSGPRACTINTLLTKPSSVLPGLWATIFCMSLWKSHTFYRHKQLLYNLKERKHGHEKPWGWSKTIDVSGRDAGIINHVRCQPDPMTCHVLSGSTNFSTCWLITSLHKQHCKIGSQMLKYRKLNLYSVQRKRMKSGGLPGTSVSWSFSV